MTPEATEPRLAPESPDLVWFRGPDTVRFLNDLLSQEIGNLDPGRVVRSLLLGPQGKMGHVLWVLRGEDEVGLVTDPGRGEDLSSSLGRYRIRVDVAIEPSSEPAHVVVGKWGPTGTARWELGDSGLVADISWEGVSRALVVGDAPDLPAEPPGEYEEDRIRVGEPQWGVDIDETTIPHESGLVSVTVDFTKGCFLGQELVARIDSRGGNVPRHVRVLEMGSAASPGAEVATAEGEGVGTISSSAGTYAMATLKRGVEVGDEVLVGRAPARVVR